MQSASPLTESRAARTLIRSATAADADPCARIFYDAFESIATRHGFPVEPPSPEFTGFKVGEMLSNNGFAGLVAERDGTVIGSAFVDERSPIAGVGPVTVAPASQDEGVGTALIAAALERERERGCAGVRLVQTAYHYRSLALYSNFGFTVREPLSVVQGPPPTVTTPGRGVRPADPADLDRCNELCAQIHGHDRGGELRDAIAAGTARVVERPEGISGYAAGFGYGWHAVAETNDDMIALLASAEAFIGLGVLVPSRNGRLLRWCLANGLRIVQQSTLMTIGLYNEPAGAWLPSILF